MKVSLWSNDGKLSEFILVLLFGESFGAGVQGLGWRDHGCHLTEDWWLHLSHQPSRTGVAIHLSTPASASVFFCSAVMDVWRRVRFLRDIRISSDSQCEAADADPVTWSLMTLADSSSEAWAVGSLGRNVHISLHLNVRFISHSNMHKNLYTHLHLNQAVLFCVSEWEGGLSHTQITDWLFFSHLIINKAAQNYV